MRIPNLGRLLRRERGSGVSRDEALSAQPVRNPVIAWELQDNHRVLLTVPLQVKPWMRLLKAFTSMPEERKVELDQVGSDVWQWCDGEITVRDLVKKLAAAHKLDQREAEVSLTQFLHTLAKRRFLGLRLEIPQDRKKAKGGATAKKPSAADSSKRRRA